METFGSGGGGGGGHASGGQVEVAFGLSSYHFFVHVHFVLLVLRFKACVYKKKGRNSRSNLSKT